MRNKWLILALVFSVMVNVAALGTIGFHAWQVRRIERPLPPPGGPIGDPIRGLMHRALSLNPDQMRELDAHRKQMAEEIGSIQKGLGEARTRMMQLLRSSDPDSTEVDAVLQEMMASQMTMQRAVLCNLLRMKRGLTPEQQEKLLRMMARKPGWDGMGPEFRHGPKRGRFGPGRNRMGE
ncbi:MAG: periplasmic heavy metal sensor [Candidatus Latescibacteria bacterium]|nr:periplasmic heavy metal sensor [Candidatus Latescibacterota bacterium]